VVRVTGAEGKGQSKSRIRCLKASYQELEEARREQDEEVIREEVEDGDDGVTGSR